MQFSKKVAKRGAMYLSEFPLQSAGIREYHDALLKGLKLPGIVRWHLGRITQFDHKINAVASKVGIARAIKAAITFQDHWVRWREKQGDMESFLRRKPLFGVYLCLKDNIVSKGLPTRAGSYALKESNAIREDLSSPIAERLYEAGSIVLCKGNMHEFGMAGMTLSSSVGQTLNPYDLSRTPGGSSGGVAAAIAMGYALAGVGTDTMNSIRSPAAACNLVGFRPTHGALDMDGIVPVAPSQDAVGPITKNVDDARLLFNIMSGTPGMHEYRAQRTSWDGLKLGLLETYAPEDNKIAEVFESAVRKIRNSGAKIVSIKVPQWEIEKIKELDVQKYEFAKAFERFMKEAVATEGEDPAVDPPMTLQEIVEREKVRAAEHEASAEAEAQEAAEKEAAREAAIERGEEPEPEPELTKRERNFRKKQTKQKRKPQYNEHALWNTAFWPALEKHTRTQYEMALARLAAFKKSVKKILDDQGLDALIYPHQRVFVAQVEEGEQKGRNGLLASLSGNPAITVPAGFTEPLRTAPLGLPVGIEIMGRAGKDQELLDMAEMVEFILETNSPKWTVPPGLRRLQGGIIDPTEAPPKLKKTREQYRAEGLEKRVRTERAMGIVRDYTGESEDMEEAAERVDRGQERQKSRARRRERTGKDDDWEDDDYDDVFKGAR